MAEDKAAKGEEAETEEESSGGGNLFLIIGLVVAVLFGVAGFGTAGYLLMTAAPKAEESIEISELDADAAHGGESDVYEASEEDELDEGETALGAIYPLESFVVNLSGGRYLRAQVRLEFEGREVPRRFFPRIVPVRDLLIQVFAAKRAEDLLTSQGKEALKQEIKDKINELLRRNDVTNVYFSQFVVQ